MNEISEFDQKCQAWLDTPADQRDINEGATLMLQANRNRILHQNVLNRKNFEKVEYELTKWLGNKMRKCDKQTVTVLYKEVALISKEIAPAETRGARPDHDTLPDEIKAIIFANSERYARLRQLHERLKVLSGKGYTACDRFPYLTEMLSLSKEIRDAWQVYDDFSFDAKQPDDAAKAPEAPKPITLDAKRVSANRKYLSDNKAKLTELRNNNDLKKALELSIKMAQRYAEMLAAGETFAPDQVAEFTALGIVPTNESN